MIGLSLALLSTAPSAASLSEAQAELSASETALKPHTDGFTLDKDRRGPALLDRHWAAIRHWTEAWLNMNGTGAPGRLAAAAAAAGADLGISTMQIAPNLLVVSAQEGETGTIFIVRRAPGGYGTVWTLSAPGRAALQAYPKLAGWTSLKASYGCRQHGKDCGPLYASIGRLPPQRDGEPRFYLHATYSQSMGATVEGQLSIWRWDGRRAVPLLVRTYGYALDQPYGTSFRRNILHVGVKGEFKAFYTCGDCNGRQMDWRISVSPDGVRDLGRRDRYPEIMFVDGLLDRLRKHRPQSRAAAGVDLRLLRRQEFDMLGTWTVHRQRSHEDVCIGWDSATDIFTFERRPSGLRLVAVREGPPTGCPGKPAS